MYAILALVLSIPVVIGLAFGIYYFTTNGKEEVAAQAKKPEVDATVQLLEEQRRQNELLRQQIAQEQQNKLDESKKAEMMRTAAKSVAATIDTALRSKHIEEQAKRQEANLRRVVKRQPQLPKLPDYVSQKGRIYQETLASYQREAEGMSVEELEAALIADMKQIQKEMYPASVQAIENAIAIYKRCRVDT